MTIRYNHLSEFLDALKAAGELLVVDDPVDPALEISAITDRFCKSEDGGPALLFTRPKGSSMPVAINLLGSHKRMRMALGGRSYDQVADTISQWTRMKPPQNLADKIKLLPRLFSLAQSPPKRVQRAPCQQTIFVGDQVDLGQLPILQCWPEDAGRFITFGSIHTQSLDGAQTNAGMYRLQIYNRNTAGMHWQIHHDGSHFWRQYRDAGRRMEAAVAIGNDPSIVFSAVAPLPPGVDEMLFAGFLRGKSVPMVRCKTVNIHVPAESEIVLEGYIDPDEMRTEGPFGDHTGYYSLADSFPVFHVTAVTHRASPIYLTTIVGRPPMEDCYMGKAIERIFLPLLQTQWPEIDGMTLPWEGVFHNNVCLTLRKEYPMQARRLMSALWGSGQMSLVKSIVVGEVGDPLEDPLSFLRVVLDRIRIPESLTRIEGVVDQLDHSAPQPLWGGKLGIDATRPLETEPASRVGLLEPQTPLSEKVIEGLAKRLDASIEKVLIPIERSANPLLAVWFYKQRPHQARECGKTLLESDSLKAFKIFLLLESETLPEIPMNGANAAWRAFNNVDPIRDIHIVGDRLTIDATKKTSDEGFARIWPGDLIMDPEVLQAIEPIWKRLREEWMRKRLS